MSRRELREHIFRMLFRVEFHPEEELEEQLEQFLEESEPISAEDEAYIQNKYLQIKKRLEEVDSLIDTNTKGWKTNRMGKVDLTIIRLAVYEMKFDDDVPEGVAINEAVELARKFGTDESPSFVNGVLAKIL